MMKELSLHILDITENSIRGGGTEITINVTEDIPGNLFIMEIIDNGRGIVPDILESIKNPFTTTRTHRNVGMGIPFLNDTCLQCGGSLDIESSPDTGTRVTATMEHNNIDRPPLGDISLTLVNMFASYPDINFTYNHTYKGAGADEAEEFSISTKELNEILEGVPLSNPDVYAWVRDYIKENIGELYGNNL